MESKAFTTQGNIGFFLRDTAGAFVTGDALPEPKSGGNLPFSQETIEVSAWDLGRFRQYLQGQLSGTVSLTLNFARESSALYQKILDHMENKTPLWLLAVYGDAIDADALNLVAYGKVIVTNFEPNPADVMEVNISFTFKGDITFETNVEAMPAAA